MGRLFALPLSTFSIAFLLGTNVSSATFSTDFETVDQATISEFLVADGDLNVTFTGGTNFTIGNFSLYHSGSKSWMIDPPGTSGRGESTGLGEAVVSEGASSLSVYIRNESSANTGILQVLDSNGELISEHTATHSDWTEVSLQRLDGESLIGKLSLSNSGTGMLALDDLRFSTPDAGDNERGAQNETPTNGSSGGSGGSLSLILMAILAGFWVVRFHNQRMLMRGMVRI